MTVDVGQVLIDTGRCTAEQVAQARARAEQEGVGLEQALTAMDLVTEDDIATALGRYYDIPGLTLAKLPKPASRVTRLVPETVARDKGVVPLEKAAETLILLMRDPTDVETLGLVRHGAGLEVQPVAASPATVQCALDMFYPSASQKLLDGALPFVAKLLTKEAAMAYRALPVDRDGNLVTVAMAGPDVEKAKKAIEMATGLQVKPVKASWEDIQRAIERVHAEQPAASAAPPPSDRPSTPAKPTAAPPEAAAPTQSLDSLLGTTGGASTPDAPSAPAAAAPSGSGLGLDLGGSPTPPVAPAGGGLSLDLGATASGPPPPAPPPSAPAGAEASGDDDLSLDSLLAAADGAAAPEPRAQEAPATSGNGGTKAEELVAAAGSADEAAAATPAREPPAALPVDLGGGETGGTEEPAEDEGPYLGPAGGPEGPKTGLKVDPTDRDQMRQIVMETWGELDRKIAKIVPERVARNYRAVVTGRLEKKLHVAFEDPTDTFAIETIEFVSGLQVEPSRASAEAIAAGLELLYVQDEDELDAILAELQGVALDDVEMREELEALGDLDAAQAAEAAPIVKLVNLVIDNALRARASDIHFEVFEEFLRIRYRVDGVLREVMRPPFELRDPVISRLKIMGKMDISERRLPQDGRVRLRKKREERVMDIDFRVSTVPTIHGEKVVMRILDRDRVRTDLLELGMEREPLQWFREAVHRPYGMVLVVGPSGCGKTNTLYSALADVNKPQVNIMTCEDPVEFSTHGLNQVQARDSIGLNFASALRSFLRQDPNVILVGEIRDFETAEIAVKAALTGHMVLSTLHTNDAPACLNRLTNMGVEPFLIATCLHLVVAQRLVRRICDECKAPDPEVTLDQLVQMGFEPDEAKGVRPMKGAGCARCENTGYFGRTGIFEVLRVSNEMREMILYNGSQMEIKELARRQGMRTLRQAGLQKIQDGITTCEEVVRETIG